MVQLATANLASSHEGRSDLLDRSPPVNNLSENTRKLLSKGYNKNGGE